MPLVQESKTERVELLKTLPGVEEGEWVELLAIHTGEIRRRASERAAVTRLMLAEGVLDDKGAPIVKEVTVWSDEAFKLALLEQVIVAWSDPEPPTAERIRKMRPEIIDWLLQQYARLTRRRTEEEKNSSTPGSSRSGGPAKANGRGNSRI